MSSRYALFHLSQLKDRFAVEGELPKALKKRYNIAPGQLAPVIIERDRKPTAVMMKWGFVPSSAKDDNSIFRYKTYNAPSENVFNKTTWKESIRNRRCLVPANGFYEWAATTDGKHPYFIQPKDQGLFSFAGLYSSWTDPDGVEWGTFSIITTTPNKEMRTIHKRMPVILQPHDEAVWLDPSITDAGILYDYMRPYPNDSLGMYEVGPEINKTKQDSAGLIARRATS